jgi:hypothetical protein
MSYNALLPEILFGLPGAEQSPFIPGSLRQILY